MKRLVAVFALALSLAGCNEQGGSTKALSPIPAKTVALMAEKGMSKSDPILVRIYKKESELEVWKKVNGHYAHLKTFPICRWSGQLGPKVKEGDRQAPEGFYTITPAQMNPNSSFYLSFDTGYPNNFDRAHNRTGSHLMVHGDCSSRGCYAMTDEGIAEVYALARESFGGGQRGFQLQALPFRMTAENLARYRHDPHMAFWKNLKQGSDHFEITKREPKVSVCQGRYAFNQVGDGCRDDPTLAPAVAQKDDEDRRQVAELVSKGTPATRLVYSDGGQHASFLSQRPAAGGDAGSNFALLDTGTSRSIGQVSRPEALAEGAREIPIDPAGKAAKAPAAGAKPGKPEGTGAEFARADRKGARTRLASADPDAPVAAVAHRAEP
ncbi:murein L,D-transpeptidase family protein, partial [Enterovirga sp.]|uniref:L,D-transpeptidase family protein n=1 Tax=Enterovirga sp. TaxID=2026350 RepID=UPI0026060ACF